MDQEVTPSELTSRKQKIKEIQVVIWIAVRSGGPIANKRVNGKHAMSKRIDSGHTGGIFGYRCSKVPHAPAVMHGIKQLEDG